MSKYIICPTCKQEIEVRWGNMASETLNRHMRQHK